MVVLQERVTMEIRQLQTLQRTTLQQVIRILTGFSLLQWPLHSLMALPEPFPVRELENTPSSMCLLGSSSLSLFLSLSLSLSLSPPPPPPPPSTSSEVLSKMGVVVVGPVYADDSDESAPSPLQVAAMFCSSPSLPSPPPPPPFTLPAVTTPRR